MILHIRRLRRQLKSKSYLIRRDAARELGRTSSARAVQPLIDELGHTDEKFRSNVVSALGNIGDERAIIPLTKILEDKDTHVRKNAAKVLEKLGWQPLDETQRIINSIALQDWNEALRLGATPLDLLGPLSDVVKDGNEEEKRKAATVLRKNSGNELLGASVEQG